MLVEDHLGYRVALARSLRRLAKIKAIMEFSTAETALRSLENLSAENKPTILLLDLNLPGLKGIESISWFRKYAPKLKIIILTQSNNEADILVAISQGASGYLLKSATSTQIMDAITTVINGGASLDPKVAKYILTKVITDSIKTNFEGNPLSRREQEILNYIAQGMVRKEICEKLNISINTVAYHIDHIYTKLGVLNAPAAVDIAHRKGLFKKNN